MSRLHQIWVLAIWVALPALAAESAFRLVDPKSFSIFHSMPNRALSSDSVPASVHPISVAAEVLLDSMYQSCDPRPDQTQPFACGDYFPAQPGFSEVHREPRYWSDAAGLHFEFPGNTSDCSSFADATIAAAGLRIRAKASPKQTGSPGTSAMIHWGERSKDCFSPVRLDGKNPPLAPGDLIVRNPIGRHVILVTEVNGADDPLGLALISSDDQCESIASDPGFFSRARFRSVESIGGGPFLSDNVSLGDLPEFDAEFFRRACHAKFGTASKARFKMDGQTVVILRHKLTPQCRLELPALPRGHECIESCQRIQSLELNLREQYQGF